MALSYIERKRAAWHLRKLGWTGVPITTAILQFQKGYTRIKLRPDGVLGESTYRAILQSSSYRNKANGTASWNFDFTEFACKCGGRQAGCERIRADRDLILGLETLRKKYYPGGLTIISAYRCEGHNRSVGGATRSRHLYGDAVDIPAVATESQVRGLGKFRGIGYNASNRTVRHVDMGPSRSWVY